MGRTHSGRGGSWKGVGVIRHLPWPQLFQPPPILHTRGPSGSSKPTSPPLVRDQRGCVGAPPTGAVPVPQEISTEASTLAVDRIDLRTLDKWLNNGEGTREKGSSQPRARLQKLVHFHVLSWDRCESPFAPVGLCPSGSLGSSGAWPPRRRASTTGRRPRSAARCKAVVPQRPGFSELHSFDSQAPGMRIQDLH